MYPKVASEVVNNPYASPLSKDHERPQKSVLPIHRARTLIKTNKCPHGNCFAAVNCHQKCPSTRKMVITERATHGLLGRTTQAKRAPETYGTAPNILHSRHQSNQRNKLQNVSKFGKRHSWRSLVNLKKDMHTYTRHK